MAKKVKIKSVPYTYNGMLLTIEEIELHTYALIFASFRLSSYLNKEHTLENIRHSYSIPEPKVTDLGKRGRLEIGSVLEFSGKELMERMRKLMPYFEMNFYQFSGEIIGHLERTAKDSMISRVFELINNYSMHSKKQGIIDHLKILDWYQMMNVLRNNASHFNNYGKAIGQWSKGYPDVIAWGGFSIAKDHFGDEIHYTIDYAFKLVRHCANYISANEQLFTVKTEAHRDVTLKFIIQRRLFEQFLNIDLQVQRPDIYLKVINSEVIVTHDEKGNLGYYIKDLSDGDIFDFRLLWNHYYIQNKT